MKKIYAILTVLTMAFILNTSVLQADVPPPPGGSGGGGPNGSDLPVGAPIDGGLTILLVLGAAYGSKKVYDRK
jgi:hypothetical protein